MSEIEDFTKRIQELKAGVEFIFKQYNDTPEKIVKDTVDPAKGYNHLIEGLGNPNPTGSHSLTDSKPSDSEGELVDTSVRRSPRTSLFDIVSRGALVAQFQAIESFLKTRTESWSSQITQMRLSPSPGNNENPYPIINQLLYSALAYHITSESKFERDLVDTCKWYSDFADQKTSVQIPAAAFRWQSSNLQIGHVTQLIENLYGRPPQNNLQNITRWLKQDSLELKQPNLGSAWNSSFHQQFDSQSKYRHRAAHEAHLGIDESALLKIITMAGNLGFLIDLFITVGVLAMHPNKQIDLNHEFRTFVKMTYIVEEIEKSGNIWKVYPEKSLGSFRECKSRKKCNSFSEAWNFARPKDLKSRINVVLGIGHGGDLVNWLIV